MSINRVAGDQVFEGRVFFQIPPTIASSKFKATETRPNVSNASILQASGASVTITNFLGGTENQTIRVLGDGTTTVQNNVHINLGSDLLLQLNKFYSFTLFNNVWYPDA